MALAAAGAIMAAGMVRLRSHCAPAQSICTTPELDGAPTSTPSPPSACTVLHENRHTLVMLCRAQVEDARI